MLGQRCTRLVGGPPERRRSRGEQHFGASASRSVTLSHVECSVTRGRLLVLEPYVEA